MRQPLPSPTEQLYRHEAFLWHDRGDFLTGLMPFVEDGLDSDEPIMVAVVPEHTGWLQQALGRRGGQVEFVDMHALGKNPARIIPAWQHFLDRHTDDSRPVRGIGEPIWPGRRAEELAECQLHEALLNVAVEPTVPFWLICPYDAEELRPDVVDEAYRSHPVVVESQTQQDNTSYAGQTHVESLFAADLSEPDQIVRPARFTAQDVGRLFTYIKLEVYVAGLSPTDAGELATVVQRLAESSLARGASCGTVRMWRQPHAVVCEVADDAPLSDPLAGRRMPMAGEHDALWLANQTCDLVQLRSSLTGTAVRLHRWL
ncbi:MAG: MEDS domain-containing protein [Propionibacteriaceae bacterium]